MSAISRDREVLPRDVELEEMGLAQGDCASPVLQYDSGGPKAQPMLLGGASEFWISCPTSYSSRCKAQYIQSPLQ